MRRLIPIPRLRHAALCRSVLLTAAVAFLAGCGGSAWLDGPVRTGDADWTQEGGSAARTSVYVRPPGDGITDWDFSLDAAAGRAGLLLRGETVFFPSVTMIVEAAALQDAELVGAFPTDGVNASTPAILGDHLFVATSSTVSRLLCVSLSTGAVQWQRTIKPVEAGLCAHDDAVFVAMRDGRIARFAPEDSTAHWQVDLDVRVRAAPAAADTVLVVVTSAGDVHGLSVRSGRALWRVPTFAAIEAAPVIVDGRVVVVNREGYAAAIRLDDGAVLWELPLGAPVYYAPSAQPHRLVFPLSSGLLVLVDPERGEPTGRIDCGELPGASPQVTGDIAYQLLRKGVLLRVDLIRGKCETVATLPLRSETPPLLTPRGIILVDEEGEAVMVGTRADATTGQGDEE